MMIVIIMSKISHARAMSLRFLLLMNLLSNDILLELFYGIFFTVLLKLRFQMSFIEPPSEGESDETADED